MELHSTDEYPSSFQVYQSPIRFSPESSSGVKIPDLVPTTHQFDFISLWHKAVARNSEQGRVTLDGSSVLDWDGFIEIRFDAGNLIGFGAFGDVYKGKWINMPHSGRLPKVVVKVLRAVPLDDRNSKKRIKQVKREIAVWQKLRHENILPLVGVIHTRGDFPSLVSPLMVNGCVKNYIKQSGVSRFEILLGIAKGLQYLHNHVPSIVHGDLKGDNVLIDKKGRPRLCDFGLSRIKDDQTLWQTSATSAPGTTRWKAPELLSGEYTTVTKAADVYAYAMTSLELMTDRVPFYYYGTDFLVLGAVALREEQPQRPSDPQISEALWWLWCQCWQTDPYFRPSMLEVVERMKPQEM